MPSYDELAGSPKEQLTESSGSTAQRQILVAWENRLAFAQNLVSSLYPTFPQCRVNSIAVQPWTEELAPNNAEMPDPTIMTADYAGKPALITLGYGPDFTQKDWPTDMPKPTVRLGTELRFKIGGSAQFLLIPGGGCKWQDNNAILKDTENSRVLIAIKEIELQWDFVDNPPINLLDERLGTVNTAAFLGAPPETLLFENYCIDESFRADPFNPHTNRIVLNFRMRKIVVGNNVFGWNHDYRESPAGWAKVLFKSDNQPRYALKAMASMLA